MKSIILVLLNIVVSNMNAKDLEFVILHNNDMHARFEQTKDSLGGKHVGGFARTAYVIKEARQMADSGKSPPVLYMNAGDTYTGTIWFSVHRWNIAADFLNVLKPDVACLGNHEFDDGIPGLIPFLQAINFPVLTANLNFGNETAFAQYVKPYTILNIQGRKIGVVGYLTPKTAIMASMGGVTFEDEVTALRRECNKLKKEGVNIIIALGHSGHKTDIRIAKEVKDVDLVVGAHTHTFLWNGNPPDKEIPSDAYPQLVTQPNGKIVPVVQAYGYTKYMGKLHVVFDEDGVLKRYDGQPIFLNETVPQDRSVLDLLEKYRPAIDKYNSKVVGKTRTYLNGDTCRVGECNFGNALTDSFVDYLTNMYKGLYWTSSPIAIVNAGSIRMSINASESDHNITAGDILGALPFNQQLITFDLLGKNLIKTLELGARSNGETSRGEFLQVAGLKVVYDFKNPTGSRVVSVKTRCGKCHVPTFAPIISDSYYRIVSTHFILRGGDGHIAVRDKSKNVVKEQIVDAASLQKYFSFYGVLTPQEEERIIVHNFDKQSSSGFSPKLKCIYIFTFVTTVYLIC